jgi:hypothetical protein
VLAESNAKRLPFGWNICILRQSTASVGELNRMLYRDFA